MATVKGKNEGKSMFLKEYLVDHPDARKDAVDEAWRAAGHEGSISGSLISKVRSGLSQAGKRRSRSEVSNRVGAGNRSSAASKSEDRGTGAGTGGRTASRANGRHAPEGPTRRTGPEGEGIDRTRLLIRLEGQLDDLLHEIKLAGGLPEVEEALRKARRILVRGHGE